MPRTFAVAVLAVLAALAAATGCATTTLTAKPIQIAREAD
jgi:hypothetical protein